MVRGTRQSKIIDIINKFEIDTQEELVQLLKDAGFNVTQATVSRDIKDLGLLKVAGETKKYKYAIVENDARGITNKVNDLFKKIVLNIVVVNNQVVISTLRGSAGMANSVVDRLNLNVVIGSVCGDNTVLIITKSNEDAVLVEQKLLELL